MYNIDGYENIAVILPEESQYSFLDFMTMAAFTFHQLFNQNNVIAVADTEKYRVYIPGKNIDHKLKAGDNLIEGSIMYEAIKTKSRISVRNNTAFDFTYIGSAYPVLDEFGNVMGGVISCQNIKNLEEISNAAENLNIITEKVVNTVNSLEEFNRNVDNIGRDLKSGSHAAVENISTTDGLLKIVKSIAAQTNILGINAAIEAARVGQAGAGFSVVASEIRKLSDESINSVKTIGATLADIQAAVELVDSQVNHIGDSVQQQSTIIQELSAVVQNLNSVVETLNLQAEEIIQQ